MTLFFLSQLTPNLTAGFTDSTFKISLQSDHFLPPPLPLPWSEPLSPLACITQTIYDVPPLLPSLILFSSFSKQQPE